MYFPDLFTRREKQPPKRKNFTDKRPYKRPKVDKKEVPKAKKTESKSKKHNNKKNSTLVSRKKVAIGSRFNKKHLKGKAFGKKASKRSR